MSFCYFLRGGGKHLEVSTGLQDEFLQPIKGNVMPPTPRPAIEELTPELRRSPQADLLCYFLLTQSENVPESTGKT